LGARGQRVLAIRLRLNDDHFDVLPLEGTEVGQADGAVLHDGLTLECVGHLDLDHGERSAPIRSRSSGSASRSRRAVLGESCPRRHPHLGFARVAMPNRAASPDTLHAEEPHTRGPIVTEKLLTARTRRRRPSSEPSPDVTEIARTLALAHRLHAECRSDQARGIRALAQELSVSPGRLSRLLNLVHLAPPIQDAIMALEVKDGREPLISERSLRPIAMQTGWVTQWRMWEGLARSRGLARADAD
jgi:hypothetical protein